MVAAACSLPATAADLLTLAEDARAEIIGGAISHRASPSAAHGDAQAGLVAFARPPFHRSPGGGDPGGWWILCEVEVEMETHDIYVPDLVGWRRARVPERPTGRPVAIRPDWVAEVLSPSNAATDLVDKFRVYERCAVPHYWIADPERGVLTVYRWESGSYRVALQAKRGETVRAEPFDAIELRVGALFGDD